MSNQIKISVGILGATGTVGQRFIQLLDAHPYFVVTTVGASERSAGKTYAEATERSWKMTTSIPERISKLIVQPCKPEHFSGCKVIFSGLDASVAGEIELDFLKAEFAVFSNAKNHRMNPVVPLIVPLVNTDHLDIIQHQRKQFGLSRGFLVTNANCSTTGLVVALKALQDRFGPIRKLVVTTMQAISGAGYPGVPSLDILGNVVPFISGEEDKIEKEVKKILGGVNQDATGFTELSDMKVSASCNRVPVIDGHTESVFVEFENRPSSSVYDISTIKEALSSYTAEPVSLAVPSVSREFKPIIVMEEQDRPQPRLDLEKGNGLSVVVGRVRGCNVFDVKFSLLSHNTILGAAGSSILNAEVAVAKGLIA